MVTYAVIYHAACNMMSSTHKTTREVHMAKIISIVIGLFLVCWSPFFIINMVYVFCEDVCFERDAPRPLWPIHMSKVLHYSNSMMNFFVYSVRSKEFGGFFRRVLCFWSRKKHNKNKSTCLTIASELGSDDGDTKYFAGTQSLTKDSPM